jgi:hypothetical protein
MCIDRLLQFLSSESSTGRTYRAIDCSRFTFYKPILPQPIFNTVSIFLQRQQRDNYDNRTMKVILLIIQLDGDFFR